MRAIITIDMDNAAFETQPHWELSNILGALSSKLWNNGPIVPGETHVLRDINGNKVGECTIS